MIRIENPVIVEGKYDKITLENVIDATIITTDGFGIFKNSQKRNFLIKLAKKKKLIIMTDSDFAGAQIRAHLKNICGNENLINVYLPQISGKEKRKKNAGKQGILGLEGLDEKTILNALERSGVTAEISEKSRKITKRDLYLYGLSGREQSALLRQKLAEYLEIPKSLSSSAFLDAVNTLYGYDEFINEVKLWQQDTDKK